MLSLKTILRGAVTRFFVTGTFLLEVGTIPIVLSGGTTITPYAPLITLAYMALATVGYAGVLALLRHKLAEDTPVAARPSIVAGVVAPIAIMLGMMLAPHTGTRLPSYVACIIVGGILSAAMFSPWLSRKKNGFVALETLREPATALPPAPFAGQSRTYARQHVAEGEDTNE